MPETYFSEIQHHQGGGHIPSVSHNVTQMYWLRNIIERTLVDDNKTTANEKIEKMERFGQFDSAVRFHLPHAPGYTPPAFLVVTGNGYDKLDAYFARVNEVGNSAVFPQYDLNDPAYDSRLWKIFSHRGTSNYTLGFKEEPKNFVELHKIMSTDIKPFKKSDHPYETDMIYNFPCGSDELEITVRCREKMENETVEVTYVPDPRDGKPKHVLKLEPRTIDKGTWDAKELKSLVSTKKFTFAHTVNC